MFRIALKRLPLSGILRTTGVRSRNILASFRFSQRCFSSKHTTSQTRQQTTEPTAGTNPTKATNDGFDETDPNNIIPTLLNLQNLLGAGDQFNFPKIVVIGNQSSGKSSVLEAISGLDILPKGTNMVTRRPLELTLIRSDGAKYAQFGAYGNLIYDMKEVQDRIQEENDIDFSESPVKLTLHSPDIHNLQLIDLPGYVQTVKIGQDETLPESIRNLCQKYIDDPNNVILCVMSATEDLALSIGLGHISRNPEIQARTLGVLTKMDLIRRNEALLGMLRNQEYPIGLGMIGVKCLSTKELDEGNSIEDVVGIEKSFIEARSLTESTDVRLGIPILRRNLSTYLLSKISYVFPAMLKKLNKHIQQEIDNQDVLQKLATTKDLSIMSKELERLVTAFVDSSPRRLEFESRVHSEIQKLITKTCNELSEQIFHGKTQNVDTETKVDDSDSQVLDEVPSGEEEDSSSSSSSQSGSVQTKLPRFSAEKDLLRTIGYDPESHLDNGSFGKFLIYGKGTAEKFDDNSLTTLGDNILANGLLTRFHKLVLPVESRKREDWHNKLERFVERLGHGPNQIAPRCRQLVIDEILSFVDRTATELGSRERSEVNLAKCYFNYLLQKIAARIEEERLTDTIRGIVEKEARASASYYEVFNNIRQDVKKEVHSQSWLMNELSRGPAAEIIEVYGDLYTSAYLKHVANRLSDDAFRVLSVGLINRLILDCIHYSMDLLQGNKITKEAERVIKRIEELKATRETLQMAVEEYTENAQPPPNPPKQQFYKRTAQHIYSKSGRMS